MRTPTTTIFISLILISLNILTITSKAQSRDTLRWVPAHDGYIPFDALQVGQYLGKKLYFARALLNLGLHIGYVSEGDSTARIAYGGSTHTLPYYQVLVGSMKNIEWVEAKSGQKPENAIKGGSQQTEQPLYIGRGELNGDLFPGQFKKGWAGLKVAFSATEVTLPVYQLLAFSNEEYKYQYLFYEQQFEKYKIGQLSIAQDESDKKDHQNKVLKVMVVVQLVLIIAMIVLIVILICKLRGKKKRSKMSKTVNSMQSFEKGLDGKGSESDLYDPNIEKE